MVHKRGLLVLKPQECEGNYDFTKAKHYMTRGFLNYFQELAPGIATASLQAIMEKYPTNADYFQVFEYTYTHGCTQKFYCIHDETHITFLLPSEY